MRWLCFYSRPRESWTVGDAAPGWFAWSVAHGKRAAPYSITRSGRLDLRPAGCRCRSSDASETSPYRRPVTQIDVLDPRRVTASGRPAPRESRPACAFGVAWPLAASASVSLHSVVGPQQSCGRGPSEASTVVRPLDQSPLDSFGFDRVVSGHRPGGRPLALTMCTNMDLACRSMPA